MVLVEGHGLPIALSLHEAAKHEVTLALDLAGKCLTGEKPVRIIGDTAYDSDPLDEQMLEAGIEMIAAHRDNRKKARTQDGRKLRRQGRRWCVERSRKRDRAILRVHASVNVAAQFSAAARASPLVPIRYERKSANSLGFVLLATIIIYIKYLF